MTRPIIDYCNNESSAPRSKLRRSLPLALAGIFISFLGSCDWGPEQWEPRVLEATYNLNDQAGVISFDTSSAPTLDVNSGDHLTLLSFKLRMFPVSRTVSGNTRVRIVDLPPIRQSDLDLKFRVSATLRRLQDSKYCWDISNQVITDWQSVEDGMWTINLPATSWIVRSMANEIRISMMLAPRNDHSKLDEYTADYILLRPIDQGQVAYDIDNNVFNRLIEWLKGEDEKTCK